MDATGEMSELDSAKAQAAFWHNVAYNSIFRNAALGYERGETVAMFHQLLTFTIDSGIAAGTWVNDEFDLSGMSAKEVMESVREKDDGIAWSAVKDCCAQWGLDADQVYADYMEDFDNQLAENRSAPDWKEVDEN